MMVTWARQTTLQGKVGFAKLDVTNEDEWKSTWDAAEKFFGGQVQVQLWF